MSSYLLKQNFIVLFFYLSLAASITAQQKFNFEHISIPNGLSNTQVWDMVQDKYGFLWIATADGLNRYDGYTIKIYKNDPGNKKSLANNTCRSLLIDNEGTLWVGTSGGLGEFDRTHESFNTFLPDSGSVNSPSNDIFNINLDSKNRIWISTAGGMFKTDKAGGKISPTYIKDGDNKYLFPSQAWALFETSSGDIYTNALSTGLVKYNESIKLFESVHASSSEFDNLRFLIVLKYYEDKTGIIWIASSDGLYKYDPRNGSLNEIKLFQKIVNPNNRNINATTDIYLDAEGYLWVSSMVHGIFRYNMKTNEVTKIGESDFPNSAHSTDMFINLYNDDFGILWIATLNNGLLKLDFQKEPFRLYPNPIDKSNSNNNLFITSVYQSPGDNNFVWLGSNQGLIKYNLSKKTFEKYTYNKGNANSIPSNYIGSIHRGGPNELWLGTGRGISLMNLSSNTFKTYDLNDKTKQNSVSYNNVNNLSMDDYGSLWTASYTSGVAKFDTKTSSAQFIPTLENRSYDLRLINLINTLNLKKSSLARLTEVGDYQDLRKEFNIDKQTDVMIVSVGEGLLANGMVDYGWLQNNKSDTVWNQNNYFKSFYLGGNTKNRINVGIVKLDKGTYTLRYKSDDSHSYGKWNTTPPGDSAWWGIQVFDLADLDVNYYKGILVGSEMSPFINAPFVNKVEYQNNGTVLIGTSNGLNIYDIRKNTIEPLQETNTTFFSTNLKTINDLLVDKSGAVWLATNGGLIKYDQNSGEFNILYDKHGLPSNYIMAIEEDVYGNLWLSTLNGISKFNKDVVHPIFINYDVRDGLQGYSFNPQSSFVSASGDLFFAGQNGFNAFHSSNINKQVPIINITQLKIANESVAPLSGNSPLTKSILDTKEIELSYSQNNISFEFSAVHFSRPEKNQYAYRLDGFDKAGWIYDNRRFASYTNLPPGDYVFRVIGSNGDGVWNNKGASIKIKVLAPWWRTIWAYIGYIFVFVSLVFSFDRLQRKRLLAKAYERARYKEAEMRAQIAEAENARKTKELEEARNLQLSMLPKELPQLPHLDIAVYMKTATEVGGDYYDFHVHIDGTLTIVLGDATGHGMMSGMMVSIMKSLFMSDRTNKELKPFFENASAAIKDMHLGRLMMALTCVQIQKDKIITTNAGMPPLFIYRKNSQAIEEVVINNVPLGAMKDIAYNVKEFHIEKGDTLLMMSDGFAELKNQSQEIFGYKRARNSFEEVAKKEPEEIVTYLHEQGNMWTNGHDPDDDVTFVVIKLK